jgi:two-component system NarL family response regulator
MILIATASSHLLDRCRQGLQKFGVMVSVSEYGSLKEALIQVKPQVVLLDLDLPQLEGKRGVSRLIKLNTSTKIIALNGPISHEMELALFKVGVWGCCQADIDPQELKRIVVAVQQGELWIRRTLTPHLLADPAAQFHNDMQAKSAVAGGLIELTQREREIAALVGRGNSNKQIARRLDISERTVKGHLTEVFRKLGINDRLVLGLRMMALIENDREQIG